MPDDFIGTGEERLEKGVGRRRAPASDERAQAEDGFARLERVRSPRIGRRVAERLPAPSGSDAGEDALARDKVLVGGQSRPRAYSFRHVILDGLPVANRVQRCAKLQQLDDAIQSPRHLAFIRSLYIDTGATLDDLREAVETLAETEPIARRVFGSAHPDTEEIEDNLRHARAALAARETPPPSEPAAATSVPDPEPDEGAVNPWLADQISKLAAPRASI